MLFLPPKFCSAVVYFCRKMDKNDIVNLLVNNGINENHPKHQLLLELIETANKLNSLDPKQQWADIMQHRFTISIRGRIFVFLARPEIEHYLRKAACLLNNSDN